MDGTHTPDQVVRALAKAWEAWQARPDFPLGKSRSRGYCVNATRLGVDALRVMGVKARPASVRLTIANKPAFDLLQAGVEPKDWPEHAWSIGLGYDDLRTLDGGWNGHLIIQSDDAGLMLDLSGEVLNRPGLIDVDGPLLLPILPDHIPGVYSQGNLLIVAMRSPQHNAWRNMTGWTQPRPAFTRYLVSATEAELAKQEAETDA